MNLDEIKIYVSEVAASSDPNFATVAQFVQQVIEQVETGQISGSEAAEVLQDVQHQVEIMQEMSEMQLKEKLNVAINALIMLASAAA